MAAQRDLETQRQPTDERTPLLGASVEDEENQRPSQDRTEEDRHNEDPEDPERVNLIAPHDGEEKKKRTAGWWLWRAFWAILAILFLALFIKGWVDAKDTNVSF